MADGILAIVRGAGLLVLTVAGLGLLAVPALVLLLFVFGVYGLVRGGPNLPRDGELSLLVCAGVVIVGRYWMPALLAAFRRVAALTRQLSKEWCGVAIVEPYVPRPGDRDAKLTRQQRLKWMLGDPATWRDMLWMAVSGCGGWILATAPLVLIGCMAYAVVAQSGAARFPVAALGVALTALAVWAAPRLLRIYGGLARSLLGPRDAELALRVQHLAQTRSETIDASAAEIRRIERDLHDGAQARLVAVGMTLGAAGDLLDTDPAATRTLIVEAREASARALAELRVLVTGIHPPVLADRGLADAVRALALDTGLHVKVTSELAGRPPAPVESAAYFAVSELLANVSKHAGVRQAWVEFQHGEGMLQIDVTDNGCGGINPTHGTGLRGIERRLAAFDGALAISSPNGGPTVVKMEIPCELSSPKTSSY
ncbi:MAG: sensor domain-containing protein [Acidimicrobiales bacterium]